MRTEREEGGKRPATALKYESIFLSNVYFQLLWLAAISVKEVQLYVRVHCMVHVSLMCREQKGFIIAGFTKMLGFTLDSEHTAGFGVRSSVSGSCAV